MSGSKKISIELLEKKIKIPRYETKRSLEVQRINEEAIRYLELNNG